MDFDSLLRGYLDGTLTARELERFQTLIDGSPHYRAELLQTLDVRSALHDDALGLAPPDFLVERTQLAVGAAFAASASERMSLDAIGPSPRRWNSPLRVAAGTFIAACLLAGIALTPTITLEPDSGANRSVAFASGTIIHQMKGLDADRHIERPRLQRVTTIENEHATSITAASEVPNTAVATQRVEVDHQSTEREATPLPEFRSLRNDLMASNDANADPLTRDLSDGSALSTSAATFSESESIPVMRTATADGQSSDARERYRKLAFGVLVGSGQVAELKTLSALLQNSYYFSFGVNPNDRIGLEMGASSFERQERVVAGDGGSFAKPSQGSPDAGGSIKEDGSSRDSHSSPPLVNHQYEQQITYGGVFYDRRLRVNSSWDLCGRVTFGGADNSVIGGVRAYAAYTPTANRNITLTLGVGGSGLYNLTDRDNNVGGNYGIYYGIETGF